MYAGFQVTIYDYDIGSPKTHNVAI